MNAVANVTDVFEVESALVGARERWRENQKLGKMVEGLIQKRLRSLFWFS